MNRSGGAEQDLRRLSHDVAARVVAAIERFALTGRGDVTKLADLEDAWRLRVGDWRVIFRQGTGAIIVGKYPTSRQGLP